MSSLLSLNFVLDGEPVGSFALDRDRLSNVLSVRRNRISVSANDRRNHQ